MIGNIFCRIALKLPPRPDAARQAVEAVTVEPPAPDVPVPPAIQPLGSDLAPALPVAERTKKRTRTALTIAVKMEILHRIDKGERIVDVARHYGWYNYYNIYMYLAYVESIKTPC